MRTYLRVGWRYVGYNVLHGAMLSMTSPTILVTPQVIYRMLNSRGPLHPNVCLSSEGAVAWLTLADLVPVAVPQAGIAQRFDEGQVLLECLQLGPQVGQNLCCWSGHCFADLGCLAVPAYNVFQLKGLKSH